jgi:DtxR family Mn-dependent transcriptional regulator
MREQILYVIRKHWESLGYGPRSGAIAQMCQLPSSTATENIRRLTQEGLLVYQPYGKIQLTTKGDAILDEFLRHKRLVETFLMSELPIDHDTAHHVSSNIAMQVPCSMIQQICAKYGHPKHCPAGQRIPTHADCRCEEVQSID